MVWTAGALQVGGKPARGGDRAAGRRRDGSGLAGVGVSERARGRPMATTEGGKRASWRQCLGEGLSSSRSMVLRMRTAPPVARLAAARVHGDGRGDNGDGKVQRGSLVASSGRGR